METFKAYGVMININTETDNYVISYDKHYLNSLNYIRNPYMMLYNKEYKTYKYKNTIFTIYQTGEVYVSTMEKEPDNNQKIMNMLQTLTDKVNNLEKQIQNFNHAIEQTPVQPIKTCEPCTPVKAPNPQKMDANKFLHDDKETVNPALFQHVPTPLKKDIIVTKHEHPDKEDTDHFDEPMEKQKKTDDQISNDEYIDILNNILEAFGLSSSSDIVKEKTPQVQEPEKPKKELPKEINNETPVNVQDINKDRVCKINLTPENIRPNLNFYMIP